MAEQDLIVNKAVKPALSFTGAAKSVVFRQASFAASRLEQGDPLTAGLYTCQVAGKAGEIIDKTRPLFEGNGLEKVAEASPYLKKAGQIGNLATYTAGAFDIHHAYKEGGFDGAAVEGGKILAKNKVTNCAVKHTAQLVAKYTPNNWWGNCIKFAAPAIAGYVGWVGTDEVLDKAIKPEWFKDPKQATA